MLLTECREEKDPEGITADTAGMADRYKVIPTA
jgi:hypothetical protein